MAFYNIKSARGWGGGLWGGGPGRGKRTTLALYAGFCANGVWCALRPSAFVTASVPNFFLTLPFPAENGGVNLELDTHWPECFQSKFTPAPTPWCPNRAIVWPIGPKLGQRWCQARARTLLGPRPLRLLTHLGFLSHAGQSGQTLLRSCGFRPPLSYNTK